jgi:hypothetical protein
MILKPWIIWLKNVLFINESYKKQLHYHIDERGQVWLNLDYTVNILARSYQKKY